MWASTFFCSTYRTHIYCAHVFGNVAKDFFSLLNFDARQFWSNGRGALLTLIPHCLSAD
jgi:hypothetical protein